MILHCPKVPGTRLVPLHEAPVLIRPGPGMQIRTGITLKCKTLKRIRTGITLQLRFPTTETPRDGVQSRDGPLRRKHAMRASSWIFSAEKLLVCICCGLIYIPFFILFFIFLFFHPPIGTLVGSPAS